MLSRYSIFRISLMSCFFLSFVFKAFLTMWGIFWCNPPLWSDYSILCLCFSSLILLKLFMSRADILVLFLLQLVFVNCLCSSVYIISSTSALFLILWSSSSRVDGSGSSCSKFLNSTNLFYLCVV